MGDPFSFLIYIIIGLVVVGAALWLLSQLPIDPKMQQLIRAVIIFAVVLWLLYLLLGSVPSFRRP